MPAAPAIATLPGERRWQALLTQAHAALTCVQAEMAAYYDARSEVWQESERAETFTQRLEAIETLLTDLDAVR